MPELPRVGLDFRMGGISNGGIGRYIVELFSRILVHDRYQWVVFVLSEQQKTELSEYLTSQADINRVEWVHAPIRHYSIKEQVEFPRLLHKANLQLLHVPHFNTPYFYSGKTIVTIHDLLWHQQKGTHVTTLPKWQYWIKYLGYRAVVSKTLRSASTILVPSMTIGHDLQTKYPNISSKITVTYEGFSKRFTPSMLGRDNAHLLYVGSLYPHKNVDVVLRALPQLPTWKLTIVSGRSVFLQDFKLQVSSLNLDDRVTILEQATDEELAQLYWRATAVVQPSLSEGFGLTGIEALACHTPLLASDTPIFREIYQDSAVFFDPHSTKSFCSAIHALQKQEHNWHKTDTLLKRYNWDTTAAKTLGAYDALLQ